jgi:hypothetical protein
MPELRSGLGQAGDLRAFDRMLRRGDADRALIYAKRLPGLPLDRALLLTLLLADRAHPRYQAAARRLLVRFTVECETSLVHVKRLADALAHLHHPHFGPYAREGLDDLVGKLRTRERDLWVDFNSLPE